MTRLSYIISGILLCQPLAAQEVGAGKPLALRDAIKTSLKNNLNLQIADDAKKITQAGLQDAEGAFDLTASSTLTLGTQKGPYDEEEKYTRKSRDFTFGLSKPFPFGTLTNLSYHPTYQKTTPPLSAFPTPPYSGNLSASITQSLLKGFGDVGRATMDIAKLNSDAAEYTYKLQIIDIVATTETYYWNVVYAFRNKQNKEQALELAKKQLKENQVKVEVGMMAPIDIAQAEAQVAQREQEIIAADNQLLNAQDQLIRYIDPTGTRNTNVQPTDAPTLNPLTLDEKTAEKIALENRLELKNAKFDLEARRIQEKVANNKLLPKLDATFTYNGISDSYSALGPVNTDLSKATYPGYSLGLNFSLPIPNKSARAQLTQARANLHSAELSYKDKELGIALEVRTAFRNVESNARGVKAAEKTRLYREKDLDAEQKKYANGMSTNFLVLTKQNDLDTAKASELQAQIAYANAITTLDKSLGRLLEARNL